MAELRMNTYRKGRWRLGHTGTAVAAVLLTAFDASAQLCAATGDDCSNLGCCEGLCEYNPGDETQTCVSACDAQLRGLRLPGVLAIGRDSGGNDRAWAIDNSQGRFTPLLTTGANWGDDRAATAIAWGDIDGDGLMELAVGRDEGDNARVIVYDDRVHDFEFLAEAGRGWGSSRGTKALAFGDTNSDGRDELLVGRSAGSGDRLIVYRYEGNTTLTAIQGLFSGWGSSRSVTAIAAGDIDGDGKDEFAVGRNSGDNERISVIDDMTEGFRHLSALGSGWGDSRSTTALAMADVDGDGRVELALGRNAGDNARVSLLWKPTADPTAPFETVFELGEGWNTGRAATALALGDLNEDGIPDLAMGRGEGDSTRVIVTGLNSFMQITWITQLGTGWGDSRSTRSLAIGPFGGNARNDLAIGRNSGGNDRVIVQELSPETDAPPLDIWRTGNGWGDSRSAEALAFSPAPPDRDGDGLLDTWETNGIDADCDGVVDLPLHEAPFNADMNHKDLFLELDWMGGETPTRQAVQAVVRAFALAPIDAGGTQNPDGTLGITLHVDTGSLRDETVGEGGVPGTCNNDLDDDGDGNADELDPDCPAVGEDLGGGNQVNAQSISRLNAAFYQVKAANFDPARRFAFRYGLSARPAFRDPTLSEDGAGRGSCFDGIDNGGAGDGQDGADIDCQGDPTLGEGGVSSNTCLDTLDNDGNQLTDFADATCQYGGGWGEVGGNDFIEFNHDPGTLMHEFGHTLNLGHGGFVDGDVSNANCKPNYLSVMNYDHQSGIPQNPGSTQGQDFDGDGIFEIVDFSPPRHDFNDGTTGLSPLRTGATAPLNEGALLETSVLDIFDTENMFIYTTGEAVTAVLGGAGNARELGQAAGTCLNNMDDDGDGLPDGFNPMAAEDGTGIMSSCNDGLDNNGDGVADRFDPDCQVDVDCVGVKAAAPLNLPPDWSGDGLIAGTPATPLPLAVDIDKEGALTQRPLSCLNNQGISAGPLQFSDDWSSISLPFLNFGDSADGPLNPVTTTEPTTADLRAARQALFTTDLGVELSLSPTWVVVGNETTLKVVVTNTSALVARDASVALRLQTGVSFVEGAGCALKTSGRTHHHEKHRWPHGWRGYGKEQKDIICVFDVVPGNSSVEREVTLRVEAHPHRSKSWISAEVETLTDMDSNPDNDKTRVMLVALRSKWPWWGGGHRPGKGMHKPWFRFW